MFQDNILEKKLQFTLRKLFIAVLVKWAKRDLDFLEVNILLLSNATLFMTHQLFIKVKTRTDKQLRISAFFQQYSFWY